MTRRAALRQSDWDRAAKAARKVGYQVVADGATIRLLPLDQTLVVPSAPNQPDEDWDKALGLK